MSFWRYGGGRVGHGCCCSAEAAKVRVVEELLVVVMMRVYLSVHSVLTSPPQIAQWCKGQHGGYTVARRDDKETAQKS